MEKRDGWNRYGANSLLPAAQYFRAAFLRLLPQAQRFFFFDKSRGEKYAVFVNFLGKSSGRNGKHLL